MEDQTKEIESRLIVEIVDKNKSTKILNRISKFMIIAKRKADKNQYLSRNKASQLYFNA